MLQGAPFRAPGVPAADLGVLQLLLSTCWPPVAAAAASRDLSSWVVFNSSPLLLLGLPKVPSAAKNRLLGRSLPGSHPLPDAGDEANPEAPSAATRTAATLKAVQAVHSTAPAHGITTLRASFSSCAHMFRQQPSPDPPRPLLLFRLLCNWAPLPFLCRRMPRLLLRESSEGSGPGLLQLLPANSRSQESRMPATACRHPVVSRVRAGCSNVRTASPPSRRVAAPGQSSVHRHQCSVCMVGWAGAGGSRIPQLMQHSRVDGDLLSLTWATKVCPLGLEAAAADVTQTAARVSPCCCPAAGTAATRG